MASERELELLDDYLRNKLSAQEKSAFEDVLKNDAGLQKELRVQQRMIDGLRQARVAELKQMLNNVPVSTAPSHGVGSSMLGKAAAWIVVAALVGGGLYIYFNSESEPAAMVSADSTALVPVTVPSDRSATLPAEKIEPPVAERDVTDATVSSQPSSTPTTEVDKSAGIRKPDSVAPAARNVFEPSEEGKNADSNTVVDAGKGTAGVITTPSIAIEAGVNGNNGKYNFHYQFKDNKLLLYGVFEKNLYELMEFFSNNKRTLFLYYKDNYYLLNDEDSKVKRLAPISDQALLKKLKDYRAAR